MSHKVRYDVVARFSSVADGLVQDSNAAWTPPVVLSDVLDEVNKHWNHIIYLEKMCYTGQTSKPPSRLYAQRLILLMQKTSLMKVKQNINRMARCPPLAYSECWAQQCNQSPTTEAPPVRLCAYVHCLPVHNEGLSLASIYLFAKKCFKLAAIIAHIEPFADRLVGIVDGAA